jgi:hypothetical protein
MWLNFRYVVCYVLPSFCTKLHKVMLYGFYYELFCIYVESIQMIF